MNNHDHRKHLASSTGVAVTLCALAALGGRAAQAQATVVTAPTQLGNAVRTAQYPMGSTAGIVPQSFSVPTLDSTNTLTFTATGAAATPSAGFESFVADATVAPQFTAGDVLEDTTIATAGGNLPTAPLQIQFQKAVTGFGLYAQDFNFDQEQFTLQVFNGTTSLGTFVYPFVDNTSSAGAAVFVGAQSAGGPLITSAILSSFSVAVGANPNNGSNDFYFGPTRVQPVPEASTVVSFGMGVLLFAGLALGARKRKVNGMSQAASQTTG